MYSVSYTHLDVYKRQVRTLGILWNNSTDSFLFDIRSFPVESSISERKILSIIAGIYNPLGLIGPIVFLYKRFMQQLWLCNLGWDEPISEQLYLCWRSLCDKLCLIGKIIVPRSIRSKSKAKIVELHGFADASEKGYGCCVYVRVIYQDSSASCHLLCSKSRVAPLRQVSLPRIELCACSVSYTHLDVYKRQLLYSTEANILQLIETFNVRTESQVLTSNMQ